MSESVIRAFLEQATAKGSRSTVLKPLFAMMGICAAASLSSVYFAAPVWLTYLFATFCALTMGLYLLAYLYCLFTDRDALRSESYSIQKMALEKGVVGDDASGVIEIERDRLVNDGRLELSGEEQE